MQELINTGLDYIWGVLRFKWTALFIAWVIAVSGWAVVFQLQDRYEATARIFVDSNDVLQPLLRGITVQPDVNQRVNMMSRMLLSRPNLEKLARMTDMDVVATTPGQKEQLIDSLANGVSLSSVRRNASLYNVSYTNSDPDLARRVVQALITIFIENTIGDEREDNESAQQFLDQQIVIYERRLARAEKLLSDFKRDNTGKMPGEAGGYYQRLDAAVSRERDAQLEFQETEKRRDSLQQQLRSESPTVLISSGSQSQQSQLELLLQQQYSELSSLLLRYTDRHPRIAQLQDSIAALEVRRQLEVSTVATPLADATYAPNPVYEGLRESLKEAEARMAELEVRVLNYRQQTEELENTIDSIPLVEVELQQLNRDYSIVKGQYEEVLARRESARLSDQVEQTADDVTFRVIDPPFAPSNPSGPNKLLLSASVLMLASGVGAAFALGLSLLSPVFYSSDQIKHKTGRPVLGTVSMSNSRNKSVLKKINWFLFLGLFFLLLCCFIVLSAYYKGIFSGDNVAFILNSKLGPVFELLASSINEVGNFLRKLMEKVLGNSL